MNSHNIHIQVAYFLHEMKRNFESLFIPCIATIFTFKGLIFFMKSSKILIHHFSWIGTKFTFKWSIFFINWNEILIHYFFHGLEWYVHSMYLLENSYSHKIHIWMYSFFHEIPSNNNIPLASRSQICKRLFVYDSLFDIEIFASFFDIFLQSSCNFPIFFSRKSFFILF